MVEYDDAAAGGPSPPPTSSRAEESSANRTTLKQFLGTSSTLGLYRYDPQDISGGCRKYELSGSNLGKSFQTARACGILAAIFGSHALLMILVEFLCCRFWCSRNLIIIMLLLACITEALTTVIMLNNACLENKNAPYLCEMHRDSVLAFVASGLYLLSTFLSCLIPRSVPLVRVLLDSDKHSTTVDPCCCCWSAGRNNKDGDDGIEDIDSELAELLPTTDQPNTSLTVTIKPYYDSKAGITLQDQSIAAYKRWIEYENIYDKTLERFTRDCEDLDASWQDMQKVPPEQIEDYSLRRTAVLLQIQNDQCQKARLDLQHFEDKLKAVKDVAYFDGKVTPQKPVEKSTLDLAEDKTKKEDTEEKEDADKEEEGGKKEGSEEETEKGSYVSTLMSSFSLWKRQSEGGGGESSESRRTGKEAGLDQIEAFPSELDEFQSARLN